MTVEELKTIFDWSALILGFLTIVAGVGILVTGNVINKRQSEQIRQFETDLRDKDVQIADANLARVKIEESIAWRRLTEGQQLEIVSNIRSLGEHTVSLWFGAGDKEAETFAYELASALYKAKWKVFKPAALIELAESGITYADSTGGSKTGVSIGAPATDSGHNLADAVIRELTKRGFDAFRTPDSQRNAASGMTLTIEVLVRPEGPQGEAKLRALKEKKQ